MTRLQMVWAMARKTTAVMTEINFWWNVGMGESWNDGSRIPPRAKYLITRGYSRVIATHGNMTMHVIAMSWQYILSVPSLLLILAHDLDPIPQVFVCL